MQKTASRAILELLSSEHRVVLSDWRAAIYLRRASFATPPESRRWSFAPRKVKDVHPLLRQMLHREEIKLIAKQRYLYTVIVPYAQSSLLDENEILMEVHPYSALSHLSALSFHGLTGELPKTIFATIPGQSHELVLPAGTDIADWQEFALVRGQKVKRILDRDVHWVQTHVERYIGIRQYQPYGYPIRVTTPERTLLDGLLHPDLCGGLDNVLRAWRAASDILDLAQLMDNVDTLNVQVLRQRVGFVLDELEIAHPEVERWRQALGRGGSSKLLGSAPYASKYSERWNLSLNASFAALHEDQP